MNAVATEVAQPIRIDIGCGKNKKPGFKGADALLMDGVDYYLDVTKGPWTLHEICGSETEPPDADKRVACKKVGDKWLWTAFGAAPIADSSVDEAHCSHVLEHLTNLGDRWERTHFFNELYRVLKPGSGCLIVIPHWGSGRYYGDPTHKEPFSAMGCLYLNREWRLREAPHTDSQFNPNGYNCDFDHTGGYNLHPQVTCRNAEFQQFAMTHFTEAAQDLFFTVVKRKV